MKAPRNPVLRYLHQHQWEWVSARQICRGASVTQDEIDETIETVRYTKTVEVQKGKYRYIGNRLSDKRRVIEYLRSIYPERTTAKQASIGAGVHDAGSWMHCYTDIMPIEMVREGNLLRYRYVPNDRRSLLEKQYSEAA